ncbi:MAG: DUF202 domain-containing protein [Salinimicrobium sp.]
MEDKELITRDWLAIDRTKLANERTLLAYFRTFIVLVSSGIAILKLQMFANLQTLGYFLMIVAPLILLVGLGRFFYYKRHIRKYYNNEK